MHSLGELLTRSSRTFDVGIRALPSPLREEITVAYLLLRVSDYLEDNEELSARDKIALLNQWRRVLAQDEPPGRLIKRLKGARDQTPDALVARHTATVLGGLERLSSAAREIVVRRVRETSAGMARWTKRGSVFETEADLDDYMHEVAGRVGYLLAELFALELPGVHRRREEMMPLGREFGLCLQTVNVIRGLHEDHHRGWIYVPASFLPTSLPAHAAMEPNTIFEPPHQEVAMAVLKRLVAKADRHMRAALLFIRCLPRRRHGVRLFCILPFLFAVRTLALSRENPDVFRRETKMTRREVIAITRNARVMGFSNRWLDWYQGRLAAAR